jgi:hypothetical protein
MERVFRRIADVGFFVVGAALYWALQARCALIAHRYRYFRINDHGPRARRCAACEHTEILE